MRKILLALLLATSSGFAAIPDSNFEFLFNRLPGQPLARKYRLGTMIREGYARTTCFYDVSKQGGDVGTYNLLQMDGVTTCTIPAKAVVLDGLVDVINNPVPTGTATVALGIVAGNDLKTATASASFTGRLDLIPQNTAATSFKLGSTAKPVTASVASAGLSTARFRVYVDYLLSE